MWLFILFAVLVLLIIVAIILEIKTAIKNGRGFAIFIKYILLIAIPIFALMNYRVLSFQKGFSKTSTNGMSFEKFVSQFSYISKIEYYEQPFDSENYYVYIVTSGDAYLLEADETDIAGLSLLGSLSKNIRPTKIAPIPFYVELIVFFVIVLIPVGIIGTKRKT